MTAICNIIKNKSLTPRKAILVLITRNLPEACTFSGAICGNQLLAGNWWHAFVLNSSSSYKILKVCVRSVIVVEQG